MDPARPAAGIPPAAPNDASAADASSLSLGDVSLSGITSASGGGAAAADDRGAVGIPGTAGFVGIPRPPPLDDPSSRAVSRASARSTTDMLSVRTDWGSEDFSPAQTPGVAVGAAPSSGSPRSISEIYSVEHRTGRRTLTTTVSPRVSQPGGPGPVRYGVHSIQNMRSEMEDAHRAVLGVEGSTDAVPEDVPLGNLSYFAIFDGHGGARAAEFAGERLYSLLAADRPALLADTIGALRRAFAQTEEDWLATARENKLMDGTTAAVAIVDRANGRCVVGNVGDSEVLLGTRDESGRTGFQTLTEVHHLKRSDSEAQRITDAGGRIWRGRLGHPKISPQVLSLSVSRAIGDLFFKDDRYTEGEPSGLTAEPYITSVEVCGTSTKEQFLLIGCDGLWDTVTYSEAADFVFDQLRKREEPQSISEALVRLARDHGSSDNITVMVVVL
mmetsp:Transcript_116075/g.328978  ORF Transcript_116075/g.328978 Transcript_116075/m.328978 type:complete len:443 (+) Transcript_116075:130-1458(+)